MPSIPHAITKTFCFIFLQKDEIANKRIGIFIDNYKGEGIFFYNLIVCDSDVIIK